MIKIGFGKKELESRVEEENRKAFLRKMLIIGGAVSAALFLVFAGVYFLFNSTSDSTTDVPEVKHSVGKGPSSSKSVASLNSVVGLKSVAAAQPPLVTLLKTKWPILLGIAVIVLLVLGTVVGVFLTLPNDQIDVEEPPSYQQVEEEGMSSSTMTILVFGVLVIVGMAVGGGYYAKAKLQKPFDNRPILPTTAPSELFPHWHKLDSESFRSANERRLMMISLWARHLRSKVEDLSEDDYPVMFEISKEDPLFPVVRGFIVSSLNPKSLELQYAQINTIAASHNEHQSNCINLLAIELIKLMSRNGMKFGDFEELRSACEDV